MQKNGLPLSLPICVRPSYTSHEQHTHTHVGETWGKEGNNLEIYDWIKCRNTENVKCRIEGSFHPRKNIEQRSPKHTEAATQSVRQHYRSSSNYYFILFHILSIPSLSVFFFVLFSPQTWFFPSLSERGQTAFCRLTTTQKRKKLSYSIFPIDFMPHTHTQVNGVNDNENENDEGGRRQRCAVMAQQSRRHRPARGHCME